MGRNGIIKSINKTETTYSDYNIYKSIKYTNKTDNKSISNYSTFNSNYNVLGNNNLEEDFVKFSENDCDIDTIDLDKISLDDIEEIISITNDS